MAARNADSACGLEGRKRGGIRVGLRYEWGLQSFGRRGGERMVSLPDSSSFFLFQLSFTIIGPPFDILLSEYFF